MPLRGVDRDVAARAVARVDVPLAGASCPRCRAPGRCLAAAAGSAARPGPAGAAAARPAGSAPGRMKPRQQAASSRRGAKDGACMKSPDRTELRADIGGAVPAMATRSTAVRRIDADASGIAARARAMTEKPDQKPLPDRLSLDPRSPHFDQEVLPRASASASTASKRPTSRNIRFPKAGSASPPAAAATAHGNPMTVKLKGKVEPYYEGGQDETTIRTPARTPRPSSSRPKDQAGSTRAAPAAHSINFFAPQPAASASAERAEPAPGNGRRSPRRPARRSACCCARRASRRRSHPIILATSTCPFDDLTVRDHSARRPRQVPAAGWSSIPTDGGKFRQLARR